MADPAPPLGSSHPLDAIPIRIPGVEGKLDARGQLHLRRLLPPRNRLDRWVRRLFRVTPAAELQVDGNGAEFWRLVDGRRTLRMIADQLARRFSLEAEAAGDAVILFTRLLMVREFIALEIPAAARPPRT